ncbi:MAG: hypothetical protein Fur0018_08730 [Anaerolineales bacterium]
MRSSATAEDLPDASFAGQQDTYLNVIGAEALLDAVRRCWASLFTDRAILYRVQNRFPHREVALSVVVQQMVMSEKSGILFTADPLTGHRHTLTIDASFGLGEALVGGLVTPDTYHVDKRTGEIVRREISDKEIAIYPLPEGGTRQEEIPATQRHQPALTDEQIRALAELGKHIEAHYGKPQDIEWAVAPASVSLRAARWSSSAERSEGAYRDPGGEAISTPDQEIASSGWVSRASTISPPRNDIFILQSRPITSLYPIERLKSPDERLRVFFSMGHQQNMTNAMAPLSLSSFQQFVPFREAVREMDFLRFSGGRLFADITQPLRHPIGRRLISALLAQFDVLAPQAIAQITRRPEFRAPHGIRFSAGFLKGMLGILRRVFSALWLRDLPDFVAQTNAVIDGFIASVSRDLQAQPAGKAQIQAVLDR